MQFARKWVCNLSESTVAAYLGWWLKERWCWVNVDASCGRRCGTVATGAMVGFPAECWQWREPELQAFSLEDRGCDWSVAGKQPSRHPLQKRSGRPSPP